MLHLWWYTCHCDLFCLTIPQFQEGLSRAVLETLPIETMNYCHGRCWQLAISFTNILAAVVKLGSSVFISDLSLPDCCFQVARIISQLGQGSPHFLSHIDINRQISVCRDVLMRQTEIYPGAALMVFGPHHTSDFPSPS